MTLRSTYRIYVMYPKNCTSRVVLLSAMSYHIHIDIVHHETYCAMENNNHENEPFFSTRVPWYHTKAEGSIDKIITPHSHPTPIHPRPLNVCRSGMKHKEIKRNNTPTEIWRAQDSPEDLILLVLHKLDNNPTKKPRDRVYTV